jgi:alkyl hydroperoxide reductase subunit D
MLIQSIVRKIPPYAADIKANFEEILTKDVEGLTANHVYGISIAVCYALKNEQMLNVIRNEAKVFLEDQHFEAAKSAVAIMALNNTYFGFLAMLGETYTVGDLSMEVLKNPGIDKLEFEMYLLAVSLVHNCQYCVRFHEGKLSKKGIDKVTIQNIGKIAAVLKSVAQVLEMENLRIYDFVLRGENF